MAHEEQWKKSFAADAAWPLLFLTAALHVFSGLSYLAYAFMGVPATASALVRGAAGAFGGLQAAVAVVAFVLAARRDLRRATLVLTGSLILGWLSTVPAVIEDGLNFAGDDKVSPAIFVISPLLAMTAAILAWRNPYPVAAALIASAITVFYILIVIAFSIIIAVHGF